MIKPDSTLRKENLVLFVVPKLLLLPIDFHLYFESKSHLFLKHLWSANFTLRCWDLSRMFRSNSFSVSLLNSLSLEFSDSRFRALDLIAAWLSSQTIFWKSLCLCFSLIDFDLACSTATLSAAIKFLMKSAVFSFSAVFCLSFSVICWLISVKYRLYRGS